MNKTRAKLVAVATEQFAERGFYGVSVAQISDQLGLTKQALLHHFGSKEKLYAEVLQTISEELMQSINQPGTGESMQAQPEQVFANLCETCLTNSTATQLLVRELLDNKRRAESARQWYLKEFLASLNQVILNDARCSGISETEAMTIVYQTLGAINYFAISKPTFSRIYDGKTYRAVEKDYAREIASLIKARLDSITAG
ncbi:MAG: TetR/AcrR family transcriptional regulator [Pseudomonadota bacterium]